MSDGVRVIVKVTARPDTVAAIKAIVLKLAELSRNEAGCVAYEVLQDNGAGTVFMLVEEWKSVAHLDAHNTTAHFHEAVTKVQPLLGAGLEVGRYLPIG
jgi:quinol monooxygenase YgiN